MTEGISRRGDRLSMHKGQVLHDLRGAGRKRLHADDLSSGCKPAK